MGGPTGRSAARVLAVLVALPLGAFVVNAMSHTWGYNDSGVIVYTIYSWLPAWLAVLVLGVAFDRRTGSVRRWALGATTLCCLGFGTAVVVAAFGTRDRGAGWTTGRPPQALVELGLGLTLLGAGALLGVTGRTVHRDLPGAPPR